MNLQDNLSNPWSAVIQDVSDNKMAVDDKNMSNGCHVSVATHANLNAQSELEDKKALGLGY